MQRKAKITRRWLLQTIAMSALAGCAQFSRRGAYSTRVGSSQPEPPRIPFRIEQLGRVRYDPYRWMKYIPVSGTRNMGDLPNRLRTHLEAEARYAAEILEPARQIQNEIRLQMYERATEAVEPPRTPSGEWSYFSYYSKNSDRPVYARSAAGDENARQVLLNESDRAKGEAYYRATDHQHSPDDRYFAWAEDVVGNDRHRICLKNIENGAVSVLVDADAYGYGGLVFSPSSRWMFWIWRDERNRPTKLYRTAVQTGETVLVYEETDPAIFMQIKRTSANGYVAITLSGPDTTEVRLVPAENETATPVVVYPRRDKVRYEVFEWSGRLLVLTDEGGALDGKLDVISPTTFEPQETIAPHRPGTQILKIVPFESALVRLERHKVQHQLVVTFGDGQEKTIRFDEAAYTLGITDGQWYSASECQITFQSPRQPLQWVHIDLANGSHSIRKVSDRDGFDHKRYEVQRLFAEAPDGAMVPITLLTRRGAPRDGSMPCLLYGYGAYGLSSDPEFSVPALTLVDRGWAYAIAHVRGGSELGRQWFLDGRRFSKRNSFTDFVACAEHLCDLGVSREGSVVAYGLSAGGLLVAGAMNTAPDLWAGVIAKVPFVDMLNTMSDADHPLVPLFRPDWGDPLANPKAYDYIASISPYENVKSTAYPPLLCTAGLKDDRVGYWEAAKLIAEVRHTATGDAPAVLLLDPDRGHQSSGGRAAEFEEMSLFWSFAEVAVAGGLGSSAT